MGRAIKQRKKLLAKSPKSQRLLCPKGPDFLWWVKSGKKGTGKKEGKSRAGPAPQFFFELEKTTEQKSKEM